MIHRYKLTSAIKKSSRHKQTDVARARSRAAILRPALDLNHKVLTWDQRRATTGCAQEGRT